MSLLDKASLIVTPNGYSEDTLYSVVPSSGAGDLSFTRATDAWRTNSAGLVQRVAWNLLQYSQQFENVYWSSVRSVVTSNSSLSPNNTLSADTLTSNETSPNGSWVRAGLTPFSGVYNISVFAKQITTPFFQIYLDGIGGVVFDLSNGTVKQQINSVGSVQSFGDGWYRCSVQITASSSSNILFLVGNSSMNTTTWFVTSGNAVYIWGAQLVEGSSALEYFPTTDRQNVPRIDYSLGGCPTLLMEPQRTNLLTYSEEFTNAAWTNSAVTVTNNSTAAPNGISTADTLVATAGNLQHSIQQNVAISQLGDLTFSCYVKNNGGNFVQLVTGAIGFVNPNPYQNFDLQTGTLAGGSLPSSTIKSVGNGWYRITVTATNNTTGTASFFIIPILNGTTGRAVPFVGDGINGIYVWGAQLEIGAYPTSYIPTTTASVTRNADVATKLGISSLLGQTEGTVLYSINNPFVGSGVQFIGSVSNDALSSFYSSYLINGRIQFDFYPGGVYTHGMSSPVALPLGVNKYAVVYKAGAYKLFLNGVLVSTNSNATPITNTTSRITLNPDVSPIYFQSVVAFKSALSDSELELLTGNYFDSYAKMAAFYNYTLQ